MVTPISCRLLIVAMPDHCLAVQAAMRCATPMLRRQIVVGRSKLQRQIFVKRSKLSQYRDARSYVHEQAVNTEYALVTYKAPRAIACKAAKSLYFCSKTLSIDLGCFVINATFLIIPTKSSSA
jgi:hypothetical protein